MAAAAGLRGSQITGAGPDQDLAAPAQRPASTLEAFPGGAFAAMGEQLLAAYAAPAFDQAQQQALQVLRHHLDDAGTAPATLASRAAVLARAFREQDAIRLAERPSRTWSQTGTHPVPEPAPVPGKGCRGRLTPKNR